MNKIDNIYIEKEILEAYFSCDLEKCKGACCTFYGMYGAPVLNEEVDTIKNSYASVKDYLSPYSLNYIEKYGMIEGYKDNYSTICINNRDCVFVYYDQDIAKCSFERAFLDGKITFRKPLSCHLYPIRCRRNGNISIYYDKIEECNPAVKKGEKEKILLIESLKEPLQRAFSKRWYNQLKKIVNDNLIV